MQLPDDFGGSQEERNAWRYRELCARMKDMKPSRAGSISKEWVAHELLRLLMLNRRLASASILVSIRRGMLGSEHVAVTKLPGQSVARLLYDWDESLAQWEYLTPRQFSDQALVPLTEDGAILRAAMRYLRQEGEKR
jgi:hypothetical protein